MENFQLAGCQKELLFSRKFMPKKQCVIYSYKYRQTVSAINTNEITANAALNLDELILRGYYGTCQECKQTHSYGCSKDTPQQSLPAERSVLLSQYQWCDPHSIPQQDTSRPHDTVSHDAAAT